MISDPAELLKEALALPPEARCFDRFAAGKQAVRLIPWNDAQRELRNRLKH
ncbi:MAG TPA: hypothetical protein VK789_33255 [Bryobacteraceae bacterium]|nr:hypothetical protein [Bryobacteraceae bacterium]